MNLREVKQALENKGILVALNLGVHVECGLDSNCPLAIKMRQTVQESGITLDELVEGHQDTSILSLENLQIEMPPDFAATIHIEVGGNNIELPMAQFLSVSIRRAIGRSIADFTRDRDKIQELGKRLICNWRREIQKAKRDVELPMPNFSPEVLLRNGCVIGRQDERYSFLFNGVYHPEYIVKDGVRYALNSEDIAQIRQKAWLKLIIGRDNTFVTAKLLDEIGRKLIHYHGSHDRDCWGAVGMINKWNGSLEKLVDFKNLLYNSLTTINYNSPLTAHPPDMPLLKHLWERSTIMGEEGQMAPQDTVEQERATGWGTGWRG